MRATPASWYRVNTRLCPPTPASFSIPYVSSQGQYSSVLRSILSASESLIRHAWSQIGTAVRFDSLIIARVRPQIVDVFQFSWAPSRLPFFLHASWPLCSQQLDQMFFYQVQTIIYAVEPENGDPVALFCDRPVLPSCLVVILFRRCISFCNKCKLCKVTFVESAWQSAHAKNRLK